MSFHAARREAQPLCRMRCVASPPAPARPGRFRGRCPASSIGLEAMMKVQSATPDPPSFAKPVLRPVAKALLLAAITMTSSASLAATLSNPVCPSETVFFGPGNGQDIVVPAGFSVSVFAQGLNFPVGIAFKGNKNHFEVYVLESGHGLPSRCN